MDTDGGGTSSPSTLSAFSEKNLVKKPPFGHTLFQMNVETFRILNKALSISGVAIKKVLDSLPEDNTHERALFEEWQKEIEKAHETLIKG